MSTIKDLNDVNQRIAYLKSERKRIRTEFIKTDLATQTDDYMLYENQLEQIQTEIKSLEQKGYEIQKKLPFKNKYTIWKKD